MDRKVLLVFILIVFMHLLFNQSLQLHYDEAYYWVWSKNLALSYYDHPPMIAYLIRLTTLFSDKEFFVRLAAVLCSTTTVIMMYKTALRMFGQKAADVTVLLALAWPILEGTFFITTIDSPLLMFWSITLYCVVRGFIENELKFVYLAGLFLGCSLLSKYTAILILPGILIYLILAAKKRNKLWNINTYLALLMAIVVFSPVIIWNAGHDWVSFAFQFKHGIASDKSLNFASFGDYIGSTIGAANPFISLTIFAFIFVKRKQLLRDERYLLLVSIFLFVVVFFAYNSLFKFMEANWVAPAYISGIIFAAACLTEYNLKWVYRTAITLILILLPIAKMPGKFVPKQFQSKIPAVNAFMGNQQLYDKIRQNYLHAGDIVLSCDYGNASRGWYYLGQGRTYVLSNFKFTDNYQYWNDKLSYPIQNALYYCDNDDSGNITLLKDYFKEVKPLGSIAYRDNFVNNKLYLYRLSN
ncbi:ArnT family glycosyltransferase [Aquella oligotrophica]|uniref:Glycosyltransferase RgtA/B/C/D-like domain-containing protein n=1 Tax=Aquella oligotrophica TaxID=2067065 RepID=A0A2I7N726_9NEIS|nr:glycosyltransferase family 39 protein [Aquella oligotrophica]AUR52251.1 hypothetical protein CUN60_08075 [Aquella oligotrophica]